MKRVLIIGKGWLGNRLENHLPNQYEVITTKRNSDSENCISINFDQKIDKNIFVNNYDSIIITVPFGKRNSMEELDFRFNQLIEFINVFTKQIILISSVGIYPEKECIINETIFSDDQLNQPYQFIEQKLKIKYPQLVVLRLGGLMGDDRYLSKYIKLDGSNLNNVVNHIHYKDVCRIIELLIEQNVECNIYNVVAPEHPSKEEILEYKINHKMIKSDTKNGKTISSEKIINELNYQFVYSNPIYFKE